MSPEHALILQSFYYFLCCSSSKNPIFSRNTNFVFLSPFVLEKFWPCLNISSPKVWVIEGETVLHCFVEYHRVVSTDQSLNKCSKKNYFSCLKTIIQKDRVHRNKGAKSCKWRQTTLPSRKISFVCTTWYRWNHVIFSIYSQLAVKQKREAFPAKSYLLHVYCLFSLFRLLRKC